MAKILKILMVMLSLHHNKGSNMKAAYFTEVLWPCLSYGAKKFTVGSL